MEQDDDQNATINLQQGSPPTVSNTTADDGDMTTDEELSSQRADSTTMGSTGIQDYLNNHQEIGSWYTHVMENAPLEDPSPPPKSSTPSSVVATSKPLPRYPQHHQTSTDRNHHGLRQHNHPPSSHPMPVQPQTRLPEIVYPFYLLVKNINYKATKNDIFYFFGGYKNIVAVNIHEKPYSHGGIPFNGNDGQCMLACKDFNACINVLQMNGRLLLERQIVVYYVNCLDNTTYNFNEKQLLELQEGKRPYQRKSSFGSTGGPLSKGPSYTPQPFVPNFNHQPFGQHVASQPSVYKTGPTEYRHPRGGGVGNYSSNDVRNFSQMKPLSNTRTSYSGGYTPNQHYEAGAPANFEIRPQSKGYNNRASPTPLMNQTLSNPSSSSSFSNRSTPAGGPQQSFQHYSHSRKSFNRTDQRDQYDQRRNLVTAPARNSLPPTQTQQQQAQSPPAVLKPVEPVKNETVFCGAKPFDSNTKLLEFEKKIKLEEREGKEKAEKQRERERAAAAGEQKAANAIAAEQHKGKSAAAEHSETKEKVPSSESISAKSSVASKSQSSRDQRRNSDKGGGHRGGGGKGRVFRSTPKSPSTQSLISDKEPHSNAKTPPIRILQRSEPADSNKKKFNEQATAEKAEPEQRKEEVKETTVIKAEPERKEYNTAKGGKISSIGPSSNRGHPSHRGPSSNNRQPHNPLNQIRQHIQPQQPDQTENHVKKNDETGALPETIEAATGQQQPSQSLPNRHSHSGGGSGKTFINSNTQPKEKVDATREKDKKKKPKKGSKPSAQGGGNRYLMLANLQDGSSS